MRYWLMKSEPEVFSIDHLAERGREPWDGVRNYQARNFMRDDMKVGDGVLFYHSSAEAIGVAGIARVAREAYPDPTAFDPDSPYFDPKSDPANPRWLMVDVELVEKLPAVVPLEVLRKTPGLEDMMVLKKGMRLSVQPVTAAEWDIVLSMGRKSRESESAPAAKPVARSAASAAGKPAAKTPVKPAKSTAKPAAKALAKPAAKSAAKPAAKTPVKPTAKTPARRVKRP